MSQPSGKKAARQRAAEMREEQARRDRQRERWFRIGIAVAIVVALVIVGIVVQMNRAETDPEAALPQGVSEPTGGVPVGSASAPVTVDVWLDLQCPFCAQFEATNAATLEQLAADGDAQVIYHPLSFIGEESERAANAYGCAVDEGVGQEFLTAVFAAHPGENTGFYTNEQLIEIGSDVGATGDEFEQCVNDDTYGAWVSNVAGSMSDAGVTGTPTVFIDGERVGDDDLNAMLEDETVIRELVQAAA